MKVAVYSRVVEFNHPYEAQLFFDELIKQQIQPVVFQPYFEQIRTLINVSDQLATFSDSSDLDDTIDFLISLGGDGTLLDTVTLVRDKKHSCAGHSISAGLGFWRASAKMI